MAQQVKKKQPPAEEEGGPWLDRARDFAQVVQELMENFGAGEQPDPVTLPTIPLPPEPTEKEKKRRKIGDALAGAGDIAGGLGQAVGAYQMSRAGRATPPYQPVGATRRRRITQRAEEQEKLAIQEKNAEIARRQAELNARMMSMASPGQSMLRSLLPSLASGMFARQGYDRGPSDLEELRAAPWFQALPPEEQALHEQRLMGTAPPEGRPGTSRPASAIQAAEYLKNEPWFQALPPEQQTEMLQGILTREGQPDLMSLFARLAGGRTRPDLWGDMPGAGEVADPTIQTIMEFLEWRKEQQGQGATGAPPPGADMSGFAAPEWALPPAGQTTGAEAAPTPPVAAAPPQPPPPDIPRMLEGYKRLVADKPNQADAIRKDFMRQYGIDPETGLPVS